MFMAITTTSVTVTPDDQKIIQRIRKQLAPDEGRVSMSLIFRKAIRSLDRELAQ